MALYDMHVHLGWFDDVTQVADSMGDDLCAFAATVTPDEHLGLRDALSGHANVRVGVGLHPWWVADGSCDDGDVARAASLAFDATFVGEVGLDFSPAHASGESHGRQVAALTAILSACDSGARSQGRKLLSIHAVRSAGTVLDLLEDSGCVESCDCVFHWFSGSGDELHRCVIAGCYFSINEMMLRTRRGREYARQLPAERLLLETDLPPERGSKYDARTIGDSLKRTLDEVSRIRKTRMDDVIASTSARLLGM